LQREPGCVFRQRRAIRQRNPIHFDAQRVNGYAIADNSHQALEQMTRRTPTDIKVASGASHVVYWRLRKLDKHKVAFLQVLMDDDVESLRETVCAIIPDSDNKRET